LGGCTQQINTSDASPRVPCWECFLAQSPNNGSVKGKAPVGSGVEEEGGGGEEEEEDDLEGCSLAMDLGNAR
jgi:hypothetical protein